MPINNITQTISTIPPAGARGVDVQTQFVIKQEDFQDHLQGTTVTELNTLKDQLNSRIGEINSTTTTMNGYANTASAGASTATTKAGEASTSATAALSYKNQAETFKNNASASATKASQWADNNYNVEVETGKYSAKHWSTVAQNATANKIDKVASTDNAIVRFDGATGQVQNSSVVIDDNGNLLLLSGALGYGAGAGGIVTQLTSKSTAVTLNKPTGAIIMNNAALAQNIKVSFLLYNSIIGPYDNIHITVTSGSSVLSQYEARGRCSGGVAEIVVSHTYEGTIGESIKLTFTVLKGAIA